MGEKTAQRQAEVKKRERERERKEKKHFHNIIFTVLNEYFYIFQEMKEHFFRFL